MLSAQPSLTRERPLALLQKQERCSAWEDEHLHASPLHQLAELWHFSSVISPPPRSPTSALSASSSVPAPHLTTTSPPSPAVLPLHQRAQPTDAASAQKQGALHRIFNAFDQNRDGLVSTHEIILMFQKLGIPQNQCSIQSLLTRHVTKTAGHVDEQEFWVLYHSACGNSVVEPDSSSASQQAGVDEDLLAAFKVFDKDGNGLISPLELQSVLCSLGFPQARQLDACVEMISRVDAKWDGHVDFLEFKKLFDVDNSNLLISSF